MQVIASYYPSTEEIFEIYNSKEEALKAIKMLNLFSRGGEKLQVGVFELTEEEYAALVSN